jgi:hypothetical protein
VRPKAGREREEEPMSLLTVSIAGSVLSLVMMAAGFLWLGLRHQLEVTRMSPGEAADFTQRGWRQRPAATWFRGWADGFGVYAEKPTREIVDLLLAGKWADGLPWATPALGALLAFFFWPLLIGQFLGLTGFALWALALFFAVSALYAAWPRGPRGGRS